MRGMSNATSSNRPYNVKKPDNPAFEMPNCPVLLFHKASVQMNTPVRRSWPLLSVRNKPQEILEHLRYLGAACVSLRHKSVVAAVQYARR